MLCAESLLQLVVHPATAGVSKTEKASAVAAAAADQGRDERHIGLVLGCLWYPSVESQHKCWV